MSNLTKRMLAVFATLLMTIGLAAALSTSASAAPAGADATAAPAAETTATTAKAENLTTPVVARKAARRKNFGALHVNFRDFQGGYSYDKRTKKAAKKSSMKMCRSRSTHDKNCKLAAWVRNGCAAVAVRIKNGKVVKARTAIAFTKKKAVRKAKRKVGARAKRYSYVCTTRYR